MGTNLEGHQFFLPSPSGSKGNPSLLYTIFKCERCVISVPCCQRSAVEVRIKIKEYEFWSYLVFFASSPKEDLPNLKNKYWYFGVRLRFCAFSVNLSKTSSLMFYQCTCARKIVQYVRLNGHCIMKARHLLVRLAIQWTSAFLLKLGMYRHALSMTDPY